MVSALNFSQAGLIALGLLFSDLPALALNANSQIDTACRHGDRRGVTAINPAGQALASVYENYCRLAFGVDLYASDDSLELQLTAWAEQEYLSDKLHGEDAHEARWLWQNSYLRWSASDRLQLSFGVSNHEQGPGYAWNPSNPFFDIRLNERDSALVFRREAEPMLAASYNDDSGAWRFMALQHEAFPLDYAARGRDSYSYMLSREQLFAASQLTLNLAVVESAEFASFAWEWTATDQLAVHTELAARATKKLPYFSAEEIFPGAWLAEFDKPHHEEEQGDWYGNAMLGLQYTLSNNVNFILEYFYQQDAWSDEEWFQLQSEVTRQNAQLDSGVLPEAASGFLLETHRWLRLLHREYMFARIAVPELIGATELAIFARHNLQDSSFIVGLSVEAAVGDNLSLGASYQIHEGEEISEAYWIPLKNEFAVKINYKF